MDALFYLSYAALWLLLLIEGMLLVLLYRHIGVQALGTADGVQRDGLPIGEIAPPLSGVTSTGERIAWAQRPERPQLLLFVAPECAPCARILPYAKHLGAAAHNQVGLTMLAVVAGQPDAAAQLVEKFALPFPCLAEEGTGTADRYRVRVTPFAFVIGTDGRVLAKGLCDNPTKLRDLLIAGGLSEATAALEEMIAVGHNNGAPINVAPRRVSV